MASWDELTAGTPQARPITAQEVRQTIRDSRPGEVLVVLDDDPTGTQSIAGLPVLTAWEEDDFRWAFSQDAPAVYVLTNSRSLGPAEAAVITRQVVTVGARVAAETGRAAVWVSRADSTLRGHFPLETTVMQEALGEPCGVVLLPAFPEVGRVTLGGVHYCRVGADYVPVGESEFARDVTFGYQSSALRDWIVEKSEGGISAADVTVIGLEQLRTDPAGVAAAVESLGQGVLACDILTEEDMRALSLALIQAEAKGRRFVYRVGPPYVRARIGQERRGALTPQEVRETSHTAETDPRPSAPGGLVVVGSHVGVTQRQLATLKEAFPAEVLEIDVAQVIDPERRESHLAQLIDEGVAALGRGTIIVQTSRRLVTKSDAAASLELSREVSAAVVAVVWGVVERTLPTFVLAKGGITSSDTATKALRIRHAIAVGSMLPGIVSLWMAEDGLATGVPYVVFPGNVGDENSLAEVVRTLQGAVGQA